MRKNLFALLTAVAIAASAAAADRPIVSVDLGIEVSADTLSMPGTSSGSVTHSCVGCKPASYRLTDKTTYQVGTRFVTFGEFATAIRGTSQLVVLFIKPNEPVVTRLIAPAPDGGTQASR
jgi:hypothetical protein